MVHVVIGSQWGDEGKGKIIDLLSDQADYILRFHGGNNAGHTVVNKYGKFPLHLVPSGIFSKKATAIIGNGMVLDLEVLITEINNLTDVFPNLKSRLIISPRCQVIMPYHKILDRLYEEAKGKAKTGTTGRGIGPVYADKVSYHGIRLYDLLYAKLNESPRPHGWGIFSLRFVGSEIPRAAGKAFGDAWPKRKFSLSSTNSRSWFFAKGDKFLGLDKNSNGLLSLNPRTHKQVSGIFLRC